MRFRLRLASKPDERASVYLNAGEIDTDGWTNRFDLGPKAAQGWTCVPLAGPVDVMIDLEWTEEGTPHTGSTVVHIA